MTSVSDKGMSLILFTSSYPYDATAEYVFISPEIRHLAQIFKKIIVVPRIRRGNRLSLPPGVEVHDGYADYLREHAGPRKMIGMALSSTCLFQELRKHPAILFYPSKILKLLLFSARVELTRRWLKKLMKTQHIDVSHSLMYSYWFDHTATGLGRIKQEFPGTKFVSRAHGYDIYEEYYYPYYWPCRQETLNELDTLFVASEAGRDYLCKRYPNYQSKFKTAHLGTEDPGFITRPSADGVCRIVTCSYIVPVKRLNLFLEGIATAARMRPGQQFEWVHFGDGQDRKSLQRRAAQKLPSNLRYELRGHVPNNEIVEYYRDHPVDVFVNVSKTEGGAPVSIQEAISCGIPVIATSVGGNPEIVSEQNGILLSADPEPQEIARALLKIWDNPLLAASMRTASRQVWQTGYNAEVNFRAFAERLHTIGES